MFFFHASAMSMFVCKDENITASVTEEKIPLTVYLPTFSY